MKILAFDTSTENLSLALWQDGLVEAQDILAGQSHSQIMLPMIDALLTRHHWTLRDLDIIAYGEGPGSFTGLRIACGVAQGLASGSGLLVTGISTTLALACQATTDKAIICIDARMGEIYHASYRKQHGVWSEQQAPILCKPIEVPLLDSDEWCGIGSGWLNYADVLNAQYPQQISVILDTALPRAADIAALAVTETPHAAELAIPRYIRNKVALKTHERQ